MDPAAKRAYMVRLMGVSDEIVFRTVGLSKRYGQRLAVDSLDIAVRRGQVYGFLGPNGT